MQDHDLTQGKTPIEEHLSAALEAADDPRATYHIREAYQKILVREDLK